MKIIFSKEFYSNLENILKQNKSFSKKIEKIIYDFKKYWLWLETYQRYDLKKINNIFFRLKIIPYRIILKKNSSEKLIFDNIFLRKWKSDYKRY